MTAKKVKPIIPDKVVRFLLGTILFFALIIGGTYYLQSSLIVLQNFGLYAHWAAILFVLPIISGLVQQIVQAPARLIVALLGALISTLILYPIYSNYFWAIPPGITDSIVFCLAVGGLGFTASVNPFERHVKHRHYSRKKKVPSAEAKNDHSQEIESHEPSSLIDKVLSSSAIRSFELMLTVLSFVLAIWGTFFLGSSQM